MRVMIAAAALCAPWFYGGGGVPARLGFAALALALAGVDLGFHAWRRDARRIPTLLAPGAVLLVFAGLQLIPGLGPGARDLLPHATISIYPFPTWLAGFEMLGMTAWIYLGANYYGSRRKLGLLAAVILAGVVLQSTYSVFQFVRHSPYVFRRYNPNEGGAGFGTFIDRDDLAEYLLFAATFSLGCLWARARRRESQFLLAMAAIVIALGVVSSLSRGGLLLGLGVLAFATIGKKKRARRLVVLVAAATTALVVFFGPGRLFQRVVRSNWQFESTHGRIAIWGNCLKVLHHFLPWGAGFGTFEFAYAPFAYFSGPVGRLNAAHNEWLQLLIEGGVVAGVAMAASVVMLVRAYRHSDKSPELIAVWLALELVAFNSLYEFGLHVAGIGILVAVLVGVACALTGAAGPVRLPRWSAALLALLLVVPALAAGRHGFDAWRANRAVTSAQLRAAAEREPQDAAGWENWGQEVLPLSARLLPLRRATQLNPWNGVAWARLAGVKALISPGMAPADLKRALRADPSSYEVHQLAANVFLILGDTPRSLQQWGLAVRANPIFLPDIVTEVAEVGQVRQFQSDLPLDASILSDFIRLVRRSDVLAAADAFRRLLTVQPVPPADLTRVLMDDLVNQQQWAVARQIWAELAPRYGAAPPGQSDFTDANFQAPPFDGGLDWRARTLPPGARIEYLAHCGNADFACVKMQLNRVADVELFSPFQVIPVAPGQVYRFSAAVRVAGLTTDQGVGLEVRSYRGDVALTSSARLIGTQDWQTLTAPMRVPAGISTIMVGLGRSVSDRLAHVPLDGTVWVRGIHFHLDSADRGLRADPPLSGAGAP
jgi:hypothetical protein